MKRILQVFLQVIRMCVNGCLLQSYCNTVQARKDGYHWWYWAQHHTAMPLDLKLRILSSSSAPKAATAGTEEKSWKKRIVSHLRRSWAVPVEVWKWRRDALSPRFWTNRMNQGSRFVDMFRVRLRILSHENFFESPKLERSVSESGVTDSTTMLPLHFFKRNPTETEEIEIPTR